MITLALVAIWSCDAVEVPTVTLRNAAKPGTKMPVTGIGTGGYIHDPHSGQPGEIWTDDVAEKAVGEWLSLGGRRIDTALDYGDQTGIGKAIKASSVPREDIFIVSKTDSPRQGYNDTLQQMDLILNQLQVNYVDLFLIHWPGPPKESSDPVCQGNPSTWQKCRQSTWRAMEDIYMMGKARAIGVSNFEKNHLEDIIAMKSTLPAVNQVEFHPYWHETDLLTFCDAHNITFNGYSPVGAPDWAPTQHHWNHTLLQEPTIIHIAQSHNRTPAQVTLRWQWQQGVLVNPRTMDPEHMKEDLNFFDFKLDDTEMEQISNITPPSVPKVCGDPHNIK